MARKPTPKKEPEVTVRKRGRPKGQTAKVKARNKTLREMAETYAPEALNVLARVAMDDDAPHSARVSASNSLLDRAYGRPAQAEPVKDDSPDRAITGIKIEFAEAPKRAPAKKAKASEKTS